MQEIHITSNPTVFSKALDGATEYKISFYKCTKLLIYVEGEVQVSCRDAENYMVYPDAKLVPILSQSGIEECYIRGTGKISLWGYR